MERTYDYNYEDIDAYIRRAQQLRSQALGQWISAGFAACKRLAVRLLHRQGARRPVGKSAGGPGLAY